ncbi:MAG: helix-turn-helix transcriptional regulator [Acholeplasma sp.]|nr:helix-turn-helix transcriptional regulator [Acholeplasma sp.]
MNKLKMLRNDRGLTIQELSKELNINHTTLNRLENGVTALNEQYLIIFSDYYKVTCDYILGLTEYSGPRFEYWDIPVFDLDDINYTIPRTTKLMAHPYISRRELFYIHANRLDESSTPFVQNGDTLLMSHRRVNDEQLSLAMIKKIINNKVVRVFKFIFTYHDGRMLAVDNDKFPIRLRPEEDAIQKSDILGWVVDLKRNYLDYRYMKRETDTIIAE